MWAKWAPITYIIKFDKNNDSASWTMELITAEYDSWIIIPENDFQRTWYAFHGWNTEANGSGTAYMSGDELINLTTTW